jgi:methyl-accepting chemotaxis protein
MSATAQELSAQAEQMQVAVSFFRVDGRERGRPALAPAPARGPARGPRSLPLPAAN